MMINENLKKLDHYEEGKNRRNKNMEANAYNSITLRFFAGNMASGQLYQVIPVLFEHNEYNK